MRDVLLVLAVVCIFCAGYAAMGRLDRFLEAHPFQQESDAPAPADALVFVEPGQTSRVKCALKRYGRRVRYVEDPMATGDLAAGVVLAVSASDLDNMLFCAQAAKHGAACAIALCNDAQYQFIYQKYGSTRVVQDLDEALLALEQRLKERFDHND